MRAPLVALALAAGAARAEQPLATYPGTVTTRIGNDLIIAGEYYRMAYFVTDDPPRKVAAHFKRQWEEAGYPTSEAGDFEGEGVVTAFFTRQGLARSVVLRRHGGRTLGFTVLKDLWLKASARPSQLPGLEGALYVADLVARGDEGHSQHRSAALKVGLQEARDQRDAAWVKAGFSRVRETGVKREDDGKLERVLEYAREKEQAVLTLVEVDAKTTAIDETWVKR
ncbi:MAG: hypothetical protein IPJ65_07000 [Archangiaceae bacterium]|nr:hypothetical protein [Archangiaceae bacterium]